MDSTSVSYDTADSHKKMNTVTTGGTTKIKFFIFLLFFFNQKMRKKYDNITFNFQQNKYIQKIIFIYL